ncbi:hypothetical protein HQ45_06030 [Porphyromonas crevioricanis]|uniref:Uncharacterized protein n=1 Tax=Porphyromonas crevioricanis TaxID=393921 RepID=A0A0A2FWC2_9PORP|nr:hypothetical protein HQ45_06030 [Porphyromonas crevioricanis]KGN95333.1 hypothetical protein HQ38_03315 [Porphyromonas crevioricanis]SJZ59946.1 hypothetical protein SAMN02745203_00258 [Porphyromonas crevioricanis]SQH72767.1 Uncharacterised protein [Porphyromonas crevioricanis]
MILCFAETYGSLSWRTIEGEIPSLAKVNFYRMEDALLQLVADGRWKLVFLFAADYLCLDLFGELEKSVLRVCFSVEVCFLLRFVSI